MANPNPSPDTRFKPGKSGNPSGKSSEVLLAEQEAAAISAKLRLKALSCLQEKIGDDEVSDEMLEFLISPATLKLFKDSEDRAHGTPPQSIKHGGSGANGEIIFQTVIESK
ncbi:hypothetical protein [Celeribacter naphthalenivorans]|uniref:hypothetical protein n=1 Tax=Celeribacter naphthalenivorans TaxID=1614694 RepID=UPI001CF94EB9|nr:hypothetical protein [Celeribacter naphthalenivorans]